jgi:hypothetical protein
MERRKFVLGTGALATGSAFGIGTGAFTSVEADRTVDVSVAGDDSALLSLDPCDTTTRPNGEYASIDGDGQFRLDVPNLNANAFTEIDNVFEVTNQGTQAVVIYVKEYGNNTAAADIGARTDELIPSTNGVEGQSGEGINGSDVVDVSAPSTPGYGNIGIRLDTGESIKLGVYVDTSDSNVNDGLNEGSGETLGAGDQIWEKLTVFASADAADKSNWGYVEENSQP